MDTGVSCYVILAASIVCSAQLNHHSRDEAFVETTSPLCQVPPLSVVEVVHYQSLAGLRARCLAALRRTEAETLPARAAVRLPAFLAACIARTQYD